MSVASPTKAQEIRSRLGHPVIDADGHTVEVTAVLEDYIKDLGGADALTRFNTSNPAPRPSDEERHDTWNSTLHHWTFPPLTLDRATAALPRLYYERMDELGLDFSFVYPTNGLVWQMNNDDDLRPTLCRALNMYMAEMHSGLLDRLLPVASIPMHTPDEAIAEIEYSVNVLGLRALLLPSYVRRPIPKIHREHPEYDEFAYRIDTYGIDSEYDYDPVWAKCLELKVVPGFHTPTAGVGFRRSISRYAYNHIGMFATSCEALCKSLLFGGVFHRFPRLKIAALEGGMGWAAPLYVDFLSHWQKRNGNVIEDLNPAGFDAELLSSLLDRFGHDRLRLKADDIVRSMVDPGIAPMHVDEFYTCPFETPEEFRDTFVSHIYIGCEADDPLNALAFNSRVNPYGARFRIILGSDISHWDVPDVSEVLEEAYELVEHGLITEDDFRDFTFTNPAHLYADENTDFFKGTAVEKPVADLLRAD